MQVIETISTGTKIYSNYKMVKLATQNKSGFTNCRGCWHKYKNIQNDMHGGVDT